MLYLGGVPRKPPIRNSGSEREATEASARSVTTGTHGAQTQRQCGPSSALSRPSWKDTDALN